MKERRWHTSQRVINKSDGTIELSLEVGITPDLVQWVLGFGSSVEVLEPSILKEKLQKAAESVVKKYSKSGDLIKKVS